MARSSLYNDYLVLLLVLPGFKTFTSIVNPTFLKLKKALDLDAIGPLYRIEVEHPVTQNCSW